MVPEDVQQWIYNQLHGLGYKDPQLCFRETLHALNEFSWLRPRTDYTPVGLLLVLYGSDAQISVPLDYPSNAPFVTVDGLARPGMRSIRETVLTLQPARPPGPPVKSANAVPPVPPKPPKPPKPPVQENVSEAVSLGTDYKPAPPVPPKSGPYLPLTRNVSENTPQSIPHYMPQSMSHSIPPHAHHSTPQSIHPTQPQNATPRLPQTVPLNAFQGSPQSIPPHVSQKYNHSGDKSVPPSLPQNVGQNLPQSIPRGVPPKTPPAPSIDLMNSLEISSAPPSSLIEKLQEIPLPEFSSVEEDKRILALLQTQLDRYESQLLVDKQTHQANIYALRNTVRSAKELTSGIPPAPTEVGELVTVRNLATEQSLAADQAIQNLLDLLPKALDSGSISLQVYLRIVRQYAREQFVHRQSRIPSRPPKQTQSV